MSHEREIGGHRWTVETFTGRESLALFRTVWALSGEAIAETVRDVSEKVSADDDLSVTLVFEMVGGVAGLAGKIAARLSDDELIKLATRLLAQTMCDGKGVLPTFDATFKGDVALLLRVLSFVIEVNFYGPFASWLGPAVSSGLQGLMAKIGGHSPPETSSATKPTP